MKRVYKLVYKKDGKRVSVNRIFFFPEKLPRRSIVKYSVEKKAVMPKNCGRLSAFRTKKAAKDFAWLNGLVFCRDIELWDALAEISESEECFLWSVDSRGRKYVHKNIPHGTVFCKSIILVKMIAFF